MRFKHALRRFGFHCVTAMLDARKPRLDARRLTNGQPRRSLADPAPSSLKTSWRPPGLRTIASFWQEHASQ
jgi:hypothetical protein